MAIPPLPELPAAPAAPTIEGRKQMATAGLDAAAADVDHVFRAKFLSELPDLGLRALWHNEMRAFDGTPNSDCIPYAWNYKELRPVILASAGSTTPAEAERRAMLMINPGMKRCPYTTDSILAAYQLLLPGEKALCHRHTVFAIRLFIEGNGTYTAVDGKQSLMEPGDLVLTTQFKWHDHHNGGDQPAIWLDGLDQPLFEGNFPINFQTRLMQHPAGGGKRYHESIPDPHPHNQYKWIDMKAKLDATAGESVRLEYLNDAMPFKHVSRTIAAYATRVNSGATSKPIQETCNNILHCISGQGSTTITSFKTNEKQVITWAKGDTFVIPSFYHFVHTATSSEPGYLFNYSDKAALDNLGFYATFEEDSPEYYARP